jgi:serine/threonine protein kinase
MNIANALTALHKQGILCQNLTCDNVIVSADDDPLLVDYGIKAISNELTAQADDSHNIILLGPEGIEQGNAPISPTMDIWRFGVIMHSVFLGTFPFMEEHFVSSIHRVLAGDLELPNTIREDIRIIVKSALCMKSDMRPSAEWIHCQFMRIDSEDRGTVSKSSLGSKSGGFLSLTCSRPVRSSAISIASGVPYRIRRSQFRSLH